MIVKDDLGELWTEILRQRLAMYRSLEATTVEKFGRERFEEWDRIYSFFVGLFGEGQLTGGRIVARRDQAEPGRRGYIASLMPLRMSHQLTG